MNYIEFAKQKPELYGQITVNGKSKIGSFRPRWNGFINSIAYHYYTENNRKGTGGFTMRKAFVLFSIGRLSTNPELGKKASYV